MRSIIMDNRRQAAMLAAALMVAGARLLLHPGGIGTGKLRVLIVEETAQRGQLPPDQAAVFTAKAIRDYAGTHCVEGGFLTLDKDADLSKLPAAWKPLAANPKSLPWMAIEVNGRIHAGPLPGTVEKTLALLQRYGGA